MNNISKIAQIIEMAFSNTPYPGDGNIGCSHEKEEIERDFGGKQWGDVPLALIFTHRGDLMYMTAEGFRFYLPAFMLAVLLHPDEVDTLTLNILISLTPPSAFVDRWPKETLEGMTKTFLSRAGVFNHQEITAIIAFLEIYAQLFKDEYQVNHLYADDKAIAFWKSRVT